MKNKRERELGLIYIESKLAKNFSTSWVEKLKQDMISAKANFGLLVTFDLPNNPNDYEGDGLYICGFHEYKMVCKLLRNALITLDRMKIVETNKLDKANQVYDYVTSAEFAQKMRQVHNLISDERELLIKEKKFMDQSFAKRGKLISKKETTLSIIGGDLIGLSNESDMIYLENIALLGGWDDFDE